MKKNRLKTYSKSASVYAKKLREMGFCVRFNWAPPPTSQYEDVTVIGHGEFSTPKIAWNYLTRKKW